MNKKIVEGPFAIKMTDDQARQVDAVLKTLPQECKVLKHKSAVTAPEFAPNERAEISMVSSETMDREREVVISKGVRLDLFQKNPVCTLAHNYSEAPVGKCLWIKAVDGGIKAKTYYPTAPENYKGGWQPDAIWHLIKEGVLSGKSIGFLPTKIRSPNKSEAQWKDASAVIESSILLEYAIAPIPMNSECLILAVAKGYADEALLKKLGLSIPKKKDKVKIDEVAIFLKCLEGIDIDPARIVKQVEYNLRNRGKV